MRGPTVNLIDAALRLRRGRAEKVERSIAAPVKAVARLLAPLNISLLLVGAAFAASQPATVNVVFHFLTANGAPKTWTTKVLVSNGSDSGHYCAVTLGKTGATLAAIYAERVPALAGLSYVSANCVGSITSGNKSVSAPKLSPAGIVLYYADAAGKLKPMLFNDPTSPIGMDDCKRQLRTRTKEFKDDISRNIHELDEMKFVKSECVLLDSFKF